MSTTTVTGAATIARDYVEALGSGELEKACAMWEPGTIDHLVGIASLRAPDEIRAFFGEMLAAVPDLGHEILSVAAQDDRALVHWRMFGTFDGRGKMMGLAPNGRRFEVLGSDLFTVRDGKIVSNVAITNGLEFARQLGLVPPQGSRGERAAYALANAIAPLARLIRGRRR